MDVLVLVVSGVGGVLCENCIVDASIFIFCVPHIPGSFWGLGGVWLFVQVVVHRSAVSLRGRLLCVCVRAHGGCLGMLGR